MYVFIAGWVQDHPGVYHFNVVYNHAKSKLSRTADTELSLSWTKRAVEWLQLMGLVNSYYHDRDCAAGQGLVQELTRVLEGSEVTVLVLSPGFVRDCWPRYSLLTCFKSLLNNSKTSSTSSGRSSRRVMPVALGLDAKDLPPGLNPGDVMFFKQDWQEDDEAWSRLRASMLTSLPAGGPVWEDDQDGENVTGDDADVDRPWSLSELLLPLYRIMVYAFSRPEMPYNF
nr:hypothetical protein BaRGS_034219 [Batillaria attramentaria]